MPTTSERLLRLHIDDGVVTERERADLDLVAETLGVGGINEILEQLASTRSSATATPAKRPLAGQSVCFTGTLLCSRNGRQITREDAQAMAAALGSSWPHASRRSLMSSW